MAALEAEGAQNVVEACSQAAGGRRCVLTSSMLASIWQRDPVQGMLDEQHWSDEQFCRENKVHCRSFNVWLPINSKSSGLNSMKLTL